MNETTGNAPDRSGAVIHPPIAWVMSVGGGLVLDRLYPLPFVPAMVPDALVGGIIFLAGLALLIWAAVSFMRAGTEIQIHRPTSAIVEAGPYRFTRNPIYTGMFLGLIGFSIVFDSLWLLILLVPFYLIIRYGVVAREEAYLERKFGDVYRVYKARVRRWL